LGKPKLANNSQHTWNEVQAGEADSRQPCTDAQEELRPGRDHIFRRDQDAMLTVPTINILKAAMDPRANPGMIPDSRVKGTGPFPVFGRFISIRVT
jgi:hypothetical protein